MNIWNSSNTLTDKISVVYYKTGCDYNEIIKEFKFGREKRWGVRVLETC